MTRLVEVFFFNFALKFRSVNEFFRGPNNYGATLQSIFF